MLRFEREAIASSSKQTHKLKQIIIKMDGDNI